MKRTAMLTWTLWLAAAPAPAFAWSWNSAENVIPSLREELDNEIAAYRQQVGNGLSLRQRILALDRIVGNYKPLGLNVVELETERARLILQEQQEQLRSAEMQGEASLLYDRGVAEYRDGQYRSALQTFQEAERLLPEDNAIREIRRRLELIAPIIETEAGTQTDAQLIRLSITRFLENDPRKAMNALIYAMEQKVERAELARLRRLFETEHPDIEPARIPPGMRLVEHKLQQTLEGIYEGRYLTAIAECSDVLDLEPNNVLALTRLGSAYYAMNEKDKARQIWTKALQLDPKNQVLRKFLYGTNN